MFHMVMRRRELSKTAEGVVGCADDGSGHVPHERGAAVAAADLTMAAAKKWGTNGGMEAKGMMAKGRKTKTKTKTKTKKS